METWIIAILTFILGYFTGVYLPSKFRSEDRRPKISISPFQERQNFFDITNHGGDILDLKIKISWQDNGVKQERETKRFFNSSEDPAVGHPHFCNTLKKGETKKVIDCPVYSDDEKVEVNISGTDIAGKDYSDKIKLQNKKRGEKINIFDNKNKKSYK